MTAIPFAAMAAAAPDGIAVLEPVSSDGAIDGFSVRYLNAAGRAITGCAADELDGRALFATASSPDGLVERCAAVCATGEPWSDRVVFRAPDGELVAEVKITMVDALVVVRIHDVTHRFRLEEAARAAQEQVETILFSISDAVYVLDPDWRFSYLNPKACELLGRTRDELLGASAIRAFPASFGSEIQDHYRRAVAEQTAVSFETYYPAPLDTWFAVRAYPSAAGLTVYFQDVGSERREQQQRARLERVESIAGLAGGVAHDFNNVLMVVAGNADMVRDALDDRGVDDPTVSASLAAIDQAVERAVGLTGQLVRFGQRLLTSPTVVDLDQLVGETIPELRSLLPSTVALHHVSSQPPLLVDADASELRLALHNVVANAVEALAGKGVLTFTVALGGSSPDDGSETAEAILSIADDGPGMSPEVLERSADPFFTTKDAATGRGMGLAETEGIVRQAGGRLSIDSREPSGTVVRFHLPLAEHQGAGPDPAPAPSVVADDQPSPVRREAPGADAEGVRVLVVDDNEEVRRLVARVLDGHGFDVLTAAGADEAIELATAASIDLLVTDVLMPGRSGPQLVRALRDVLDPMPPVVYISGYADSRELDDDLASGEASLLAKPFEPAALLAEVWRLWEASAARARERSGEVDLSREDPV